MDTPKFSGFKKHIFIISVFVGRNPDKAYLGSLLQGLSQGCN